MSVRDDSKGFDPASVVEEGGSHVGIGIMRERAHRIAATLAAKSAPGVGPVLCSLAVEKEARILEERPTHGTNDTRIAG